MLTLFKMNTDTHLSPEKKIATINWTQAKTKIQTLDIFKIRTFSIFKDIQTYNFIAIDARVENLSSKFKPKQINNEEIKHV